MPGDRGRLHDGRVTDVEAGRQRHQAGRGRAELLGHSPVSGHPEGPLAVRRAEVVLAAPTGFTLHAPVDGLHDDGRAVLADTGELVAEDLSAPEADVAQVGAADAGGPDLEQLAGAGRLVELDDRHTSLDAAYGLHVPSLIALQNGTVAGPHTRRHRGRNVVADWTKGRHRPRSETSGSTSRFASR